MIPALALLLFSARDAPDELEQRARLSLESIRHADTLAGAAAQRPALRARLRGSLGLDLLPAAAYRKARVVGTLLRGRYRIQKIVYETLPGVLVPAHLYLPEKVDSPAPAVLFYPGHWWADSKMRPDFQAFCLTMARLGFVVLTWDPFGQGERGVSSRDHRRIELLLAGISQQGLAEYETQCALSYLLSRREVDPKRIGITGASGGGYNTWITSALDDRIAAAVPVVGTSEFYEQIHVTRPLDWYRAAEHCHFVPGLIRYANNHELLAMAAPKPLMIIAASQDQSFPIGGVKKVYDYGRLLYGSDRIAFFEDTAEGHGYQTRKREAAYGWFLRWLMHQGDGSPFREPPLETAAVDDPGYRCFREKQPSGPGIVAYAAALAKRRHPVRTDKLNEILGLPPAQPVPTWSGPTAGSTLLMVSDNGAVDLSVGELAGAGWAVEQVQVRGLASLSFKETGWAAAVSLLLGENFVGRQALDIEQAIQNAVARRQRVAVYAQGHNASLAATYAAARNPQVSAWILHGGFLTYRHFIERPIEIRRSYTLLAADRDRMTAFDREIPFHYVPFGAIRYFDLPDLLSRTEHLLVVNPIDGDWKQMTSEEAGKWIPRSSSLAVQEDVQAAILSHLSNLPAR
ncbi:MAG: prolyl oligopeptidase family serine peptidase [Bryobacteraceae bacterium]|nr:prolyl oligopeptidase family serine peptidase [Bryobacterales bacterium]NUM99870.1 prolyl oligopeptidase family serine peptidase [Bryobacteraceae bacterium]